MEKNTISVLRLLLFVVAIGFTFRFYSQRTKSSGIKQVEEKTVEAPDVIKPSGANFVEYEPVKIKSKVEDTLILKHKKVKKWFYSQIGVKENGGNNRGKEIAYYLKRSSGLEEGHAWCAAFAVTGLLDNGVKVKKTALAASVSTQKLVYKKNKNEFPFPDDSSSLIHGLYYKNLGRIGHTGYMAEVRNGATVCIEGNTSDKKGRDGDVVALLIRNNNEFYAISRYK